MIPTRRLEALLDDPWSKRWSRRSSRDFHGRAPSPAEGAHLVIGMLLVGVDHRRRTCRAFTALFSVLELRIACARSPRRLEESPHLSPTAGGVHSEARVLRAGKGQADGAGSALLEGCKAPLSNQACRQSTRSCLARCSRLVGPRELLEATAQKRRHLCRSRGFLGRRHAKKPGPKDELFFGYYFSLATMVNDENKDAVPELVRAMALAHVI